MNNWSTFINNKSIPIDTPYIESVDGTAIIDKESQIKIIGKNFTSESHVFCNAGIISNIQKNPESITFDCLANTSGSFLVEIKNGLQSSEDWNSNYSPIVIARNGLNLTNGWLDFRTVDPLTLGTVISHVNASLSTKTFSNSGYTLDAVDGLKIGSVGTVNSPNNYIRFDNYIFPAVATKYEVIFILNTAYVSGNYQNRIRVGIGNPNINNTMYFIVDIFTGYFYYSYNDRFTSFSTLSNNIIYNTLLFPTNVFLIFKVIWDFSSGKLELYNNIDLNDLKKNGDLIINFPINLLKDSNLPPEPIQSIIPLFQFFTLDSISSVIGFKID